MITVRTSPAYVNRVRQDWTANGGVYGDGGVYALVPSNDPFAQFGPTLDLTFAGNPTDLLTASTTAGYTLNTYFTPETYQIAVQYAVWGANGLEQKNFADIVTFTRASTGTYFNSAGTLTTAAINEARFDYNPSTLAAQGLLIEEARTNLLTYSAQFDNAAWTKTRSSITADATTSPDGTSNADKLVEDTTASNTHIVFQSPSAASSIYTFSVFAKVAERTEIALRLDCGTLGQQIGYFNLSTGATGSTTANITSSIRNIGNGWYRCAITLTTSDSVTNSVLMLAVGGSAVYTGNGTSGLFIWGAQLEAGAFPTSYIPTTTTALTRSADVASVNTLSPWFNAVEGTLYGEFAVAGYAPSGAFPSTATLSDNTANNRIQLVSTNTGASLYAFGEVATGGVTQAGFYGAAGSFFGVGSVRKSAIAYATNNFAFTTQGLTAQTDTSGTVPTVDRLYIGLGSSGNTPINGYLRRITYYPRRLANADLQAITA